MLYEKKKKKILHYFNLRKTEYNSSKYDIIRDKYIQTTLTDTQKTELYNAVFKDNLERLKKLINIEKYPLLEECSMKGYYWTVLHYAANYGFLSIIEYILKYYQNDPQMIEKVNLPSNLGMTPLFIGIKNSPSFELKQKLLDLFIKYDAIDFFIKSNNNKDIFDYCKEEKLLDFLIENYFED